MLVKKNIEYPIFLECVLHTEDTFWQYVFIDLSYGITPYGLFFYREKALACRFKNIEFLFEFTEEKPEIIFNVLLQFMQDKLHLSSTAKNMNDKKILMEALNTKKKYYNKNTLIENYVVDVKKKYKLTTKEMVDLFRTIDVNFQLKNFTKSNITFDPLSGKITNIQGKKNEKIKIGFQL